MSVTKIRIDISQGIVEAEGSETFVRAIYDDFKGRIAEQPPESSNTTEKRTQKPKVKSAKSPVAPKKTRGANRGNNPNIDKALDLRPKGKQGLQEFYEQYNAKSNFEKNLVFVYWLQEVAGITKITQDHIFTCYRNIAGVKAPTALYQSLIDTSKRKGWLDTTNTEDVKATISGVNYLEHDLPKSGE